MKFLTSAGYDSQIITAHPKDIKNTNPVQPYLIDFPSSFGWPSIGSDALTMLPERFQQDGIEKDSSLKEEIMRVCSMLPKQSDRAFLLNIVRENPDFLSGRQKPGIIGRLELYSSEGIKILMSDIEKDIEKLSLNKIDIKNLNKASSILQEILIVKISLEEKNDSSNNFNI